MLRGATVAVALCVLGSAACGGGQDEAKLPESRLVDLFSDADVDWPTDGKPLVVNLWASWCSPCRAEMPAFERVHQKLGDDVAFIGVTDDPDHAAAREVAAKTGVTYPLAVDTGQHLLIDLGVAGLPATVFIDAQGRIIGRHAGVLTEEALLKEIASRYDIRP